MCYYNLFLTCVCLEVLMQKWYFSHSVRKVNTAHARIKKHALNQALYTSYEKIVFDTRVRKWFYPRVAFSPSIRSGANVPTRIESLFHTGIENNYSLSIELALCRTDWWIGIIYHWRSRWNYMVLARGLASYRTGARIHCRSYMYVAGVWHYIALF